MARSRRHSGVGPASNLQSGQRPPDGQRGGASSSNRTPGLPRTWEWWKDDAVKKELVLPDEKVNRLGQIYENRVRQMRPFAEEYARELSTLDQMARARTATIETYQIQVSRVEALRSRLQESFLVMLYRMYTELTPEQYQKLIDIRDRRRQGRGNGPR